MLQIQARLAIARILLNPFTVRVHAKIARQTWSRLWYLARAFDPTGRGIVDLPLDICQLLNVSRPTLYEWLRAGKKAGAFRRYKFKQNRCHIWLGGLVKVCQSLGLQDWGGVALVSLVEIQSSDTQSLQLRSLATSVVVADLQHKSHFAARRSLKHRERFFKPPSAEAILSAGKRSSQKPEKGQVPFLVWVGKRRAFVSRNFVPFGTSQASIAAELGISEATVRRHQARQNLERRQLVQAKSAYQLVAAGIEWDAERCFAEPEIWYQQSDDGIRLYEPNGITSSRREGGHAVTEQRFFRYFGQTWLYRCNVYGVGHVDLTSMRASRKRLRKLMGQKRVAAGESP